MINVFSQIFNSTSYSDIKYCIQISKENSQKMASYYDLQSLNEIYLTAVEEIIFMLHVSKKELLQNLLCKNVSSSSNDDEVIRTVVCEILKFLFILNSDLFGQISFKICSNNKF
ncbi:hypothetical protein PGB90_000274 [Kerria lacca]